MTTTRRADVPARPADRTTTALLACGAVANPLFVLVFLVLGATRAGYDPLRHPVSSLAIGEHGWVQTAGFLATGLLTLAFAIGLRRALRHGRAATWGPLLIGVWAVGMLGAGVFVADPISGYPPGTPALPDLPSTSGRLHDAFALPAFLALPAACFVFARRFAGERRRGPAVHSVATGIAFLATDVLATSGFAQTAALVDHAGLYQRAAVITGLTWLTALALYTLNTHTAADKTA